MVTYGRFQRNLFCEVPDYYHRSIARLLQLKSTDQLKQYQFIIAIHGANVFQKENKYVVMYTEIRQGEISRLANEFGNYFATSFYRINERENEMLLKGKMTPVEDGIKISYRNKEVCVPMIEKYHRIFPNRINNQWEPQVQEIDRNNIYFPPRYNRRNN